jgi:hypothetical protein
MLHSCIFEQTLLPPVLFFTYEHSSLLYVFVIVKTCKINHLYVQLFFVIYLWLADDATLMKEMCSSCVLIHLYIGRLLTGYRKPGI